MDSVRKEVLANVSSAMAEVGDFHNDIPAIFEIAEKHTDAIMALLPQVGVKELEWDMLGEHTWYCQNGLGGTYQIQFDEVRQKYQAQLNTAGEVLYLSSVLSDVEAAKAACQADFAQRITSALVPTEAASELTQGAERQAGLPQDVVQLLQDVGQFLNSAAAHVSPAGLQSLADRMDKYVEQIGEVVRADAKATSALVQPSGVVGADMVERGCAALQAHAAERHPEAQGGWPGRIPEDELAIARDGMRKALTAALASPVSTREVSPYIRERADEEIAKIKANIAANASPVSEGEIRAEVIEELAELADNEALAIYDSDQCVGDWLRSLTNGEG